MRQIAITREVSRSLERCELTHLSRRPIDVALARSQHAAYEDALRDAGCAVQQLDELPDFPDAVFVEDAAIVLDELAVLTHPGAASRRGEVDSMVAALAPYREVRSVAAPGTLDGGDVLRLGRVIYVGATPRSSTEGIAQLGAFLAPFGYRVEAVPVRGCLHLKTAVTQAGADLLLVNPGWVDPLCFTGWRHVAIDPAEPFGANTVWLGDQALRSASHPRTTQRLRAAGIKVHVVDMSETEKAEGAVTCCSVVFDA